MIKKLLYFLLLLIAQISWSQQTPQFLSKTQLFAQNDYEYFRYEYSYDLQNRKIEEIYYDTSIIDFRNPTDFTNIYKTNFIYDDITGNLIEQMGSYYHFINDVFIPQDKLSFYYNNHNLLTEKIYSTYINTNADWSVYRVNAVIWQPIQKDSMIYDSTNRLVKKYTSHMNQQNRTWEPISVEEYDYNPTGFLTSVTYKRWDQTTSSYNNSLRQEYLYDLTNLLKEYTYLRYNDTLSVWEANNKDKYFYDNQNRLIEHDKFRWNTDLNQWEYVQWSSAKRIYQYGNDGNLSTMMNYRYRHGQLTLSYKNIFSYDNSYNYQDLVLPFEDRTLPPYYNSYYITTDINNARLFSHELLNIYTYYFDNDTSDWLFSSKLEYTYQTTAGASEIQNNNISVYPNPAQSIINIKGVDDSKVQFRLFDTLGKQILSVTNRLTINIQHLPSGVYTYNLITDKGFKTGVLIKN